jgi:small subunit ribosomal protein S13
MAEKPEKEFRGIIRIAGKDVNGKFPLPKALDSIKGIGTNLADNIASIASVELGISKREKIGDLTDEQIDGLEEIIKNPAKYGLPEWSLNRQNERAEGKSIHLVGSDLDFQKRQDIELRKNMKSYHGYRHMYGLPVWGGRTKTRDRKGLTLGVIKKKEMPGKAEKEERGKGRRGREK